jgi:hypothetical protein
LFIEALEGSQAKGVAEKKHALARIKRERDDPWAASGRDVQFSLILNIRYQFAETVKRDLQSPYLFCDSKYACCSATFCMQRDRGADEASPSGGYRLICQMFIKRGELNDVARAASRSQHRCRAGPAHPA